VGATNLFKLKSKTHPSPTDVGFLPQRQEICGRERGKRTEEGKSTTEMWEDVKLGRPRTSVYNRSRFPGGTAHEKSQYKHWKWTGNMVGEVIDSAEC